MRPVKIEFQAFGPYVGYESVDFEAVSSKGLFLICGKTGIGKTMILDAMTFALYGKSSGHGRDDFVSMRCTNALFGTDTFVKFEFENHGEYYLFERRLERKVKNLSPAYNVSRKGADGVWYPLMENAREKALNEKATEIIGLEYEQFRQVIVLPQGQFERLLTSNSDEKEKILTSILGEDRWKNIAECLYNAAEKRKNELKGIQDRIGNSLKEENCSSVSELETAVNSLRLQSEQLDKDYREADYGSIIKKQQDMLITAKRFSDMHRAERQVMSLESQKEMRREWENALKDAKRADKVRTLIETEYNLREALKKRREEENSACKNADKREKDYAVAAAEVKCHAEKETVTDEIKKRKILYEGKRSDYEGLLEAESELKAARTNADRALAAEKKAKAVCDSFTEIIARLNADYDRLQHEHTDILDTYLAGITGELAGKLKDGEACPVCGNTVHPHKAKAAENSVSKADVDAKKKAADEKYRELNEQLDAQQNAEKLLKERHAAVENANADVGRFSERLENKTANLVKGIATAEQLETEIRKLQEAVDEYESMKKQLAEAEKDAEKAKTDAKAKLESAKKETTLAESAYKKAEEALAQGLADNAFTSCEEAEKLMLDDNKTEELSSMAAQYDAAVKTANNNLNALRAELEGKAEADEAECNRIMEEAQKAQDGYKVKSVTLHNEISRLSKKADALKKEGSDIEEKIREAEEDFAFARKLRGDSGTGLQRYVLGIMFSSVVAAANRMLEMVHGGRYRLYRSDEKAQGTNKRGLELKVFDRNSGEHDGRFVSTLSGGEKFLASLALSIGMSTVAQKSGIKIEALFIDEGFGSLDDDSIDDAMNILNSIQEANGLVGIISHVQILQDRIPTKLKVEEDEHGSHIVQTVG